MHITEISIQNFRNITALRLVNLPPGVLLTGMNGAGKSSALEAIRYALYGRCGNTDKRGARADRLIADGQHEAHIQLRIVHGEHDLTVLSVIGRRSNDWSCSEHATGEVFAAYRADMWDALGIDADHAEIGAAMASYLADGFDRVINGYLAETIPVFDVLEHTGGHHDWFKRWMAQQGLTADAYTPDQWREMGATIYGARTEINKQIKEYSYEIELIGFVAPPVDGNGETIPVEKLGACKSKVAGMESAREDLLKELGGAGAKRSASTIKNDLTQKSAELKQKEAAVLALRESVAVTERAKQDAETEMRTSMTAESHLRGRKVELESLAKRFHDGVCDKCGSKLTKKQLTELVGTAASDVLALGKEHAEMTAQIERVKLAVAEHTGRLNDLRGECARAEGERAAVSADCAVLEREQPAGRTRDEVQADIDEMDVKLTTGRDIVARLEKMSNHAGMTERLAQLKAEADHMTFFCDALKKGELIARLSQGDRKAQLLARVNTELQPMGYQLDIRPDGKSLSVFLGRGGVLRPLAMCSQGERWLAEFALAVGFAGGGPVVLDNLDHLDGVNREHVRKRLRKVDGSVWLAMAWKRRESPGPEVAAAFEPARLVWIADGKVVTRKESAA